MNNQQQPVTPVQEETVEVADIITTEDGKNTQELTSPIQEEVENKWKDPYAFDLEETQLTFADVIGKVTGEESTEPSVLGLQPSGGPGRSKFIPNCDTTRRVSVFDYPQGPVLVLRRNSDKETEGITITDIAFRDAFNKLVSSLSNRTQVTFQLMDGTLIVGYVKKPENGRSKAYLPLAHFPKNIEPPKLGLVQRVRIARLIIG